MQQISVIYKSLEGEGTEEFAYVPGSDTRSLNFNKFGVVLAYDPQSQQFVPWHRIEEIQYFSPNGRTTLKDYMDRIGG